MMTNDDNLESDLLTSSLLKIRSLYKFCRVLLQVALVEPVYQEFYNRREIIPGVHFR